MYGRAPEMSDEWIVTTCRCRRRATARASVRKRLRAVGSAVATGT